MAQPLRLLLPALLFSLVLAAPHGRGAPPEKKPPRVDAHGDPLPEGALARLGTIRFRDGGYFSATALSPDGKLLALASNSGTMRLLDAATGKEVRNFRTNGGGFPWMSFSPDGKLLAAADYGTRIQFWEVATGNAVHPSRSTTTMSASPSPATARSWPRPATTTTAWAAAGAPNRSSETGLFSSGMSPRARS